MTGRFRVVIGGREWTAVVAGESVTLAGVDGAFTVHLDQDGRARIDSTGGTRAIVAARSGEHVWLGIDGETIEATVTAGGRRAAHAAHDDDALSAPMAATVVKINVGPGDRVRDGDTLIALEAMKMELPIRAPHAGIVRQVLCREGDLVQPGTALVDLEPIAADVPS